MLLKIYAFVWLSLIAAAGFLLAIAGPTEVVLTVLGFAFSTLFFAGLFGVLPWQMNEHYSRHLPPEGLAGRDRKRNLKAAGRLRKEPSAKALPLAVGI